MGYLILLWPEHDAPSDEAELLRWLSLGGGGGGGFSDNLEVGEGGA
jgi:hypothetical protein